MGRCHHPSIHSFLGICQKLMKMNPEQKHGCAPPHSPTICLWISPHIRFFSHGCDKVSGQSSLKRKRFTLAQGQGYSLSSRRAVGRQTEKNAGTQLAFSFLFSLELYGRWQPTVRIGLPIQLSHIQTPLEISPEVCLLHGSRGQILLFVSHLTSNLQSLNSQRKPGNAPPYAKWLRVLTDYITPILQKGRRSLGWEQKWPEVRSERTRHRTLGLPGQPTDSANCHMLTVCALSGLWDTSGNQRHLQLTDKCAEGRQFPREDSPLWESLQTLHQRTGPADLDSK